MIEKFEKWVIKIKEKTNPKYFGVFMFAVFGAITLALMNYINVFGREKGKSTDTNNRAMYEIITNVNNIDTLVAKVRITSSKEFNIQTLSNILAEANAAKDNLSILPVPENTMRNAFDFLSQVIGYSESLIKKLAKGESLETDDYTNLEKINKVANNLNNTLNEIYEKLSVGRINWDEVEEVATKEINDNNNSLKLEGVENVKKTLQDYEGLIYDGAFSSHIESMNAKMLNGKEITKDEGIKKAEIFVKSIFLNLKDEKQIEKVTFLGESKGRINSLNYEVKLKDSKDNISVDISKDSGYLLLLMYNREVLKKNITIDEAQIIGEKYLSKIGFESLEATYFLEQQNTITINFAGVQNEVILYPDLIKVKIAMDTGEILSVETTGYIFNHHIRYNLKPLLSESEAKNNINKNIDMENIRLAVIPTSSKKEVLTYEFKGKINNNVFLIYINAITGVEENVLLLLKTKGGYVTI